MPSPSAPATTVHPAQPSHGAVDLSRPQTASGAELLSDDEAVEFAVAEQTIRAGRDTFVSVGDALERIRDERLYRESHRTFEAYCQEVWGWGRRYVNLTIGSAACVRDLPGNLGTIVPNEASARELSKVEPEKRVAVLTEAAAAGPVTAKAIKAAAKPKPAPAAEPAPMSLPAHPAPVREDSQTRAFRVSLKLKESTDGTESFLSALNPTRKEMLQAALHHIAFGRRLEAAAAQMEDSQ